MFRRTNGSQGREMAPERELRPGDWAIMALLAEQPSHGWALAETLKPDGEIGAVWHLARPVVYRTLESLEQQGLIEPVALERSPHGPHRVVFTVASRGRGGLYEWLAEPVEHITEIRSLFLLNLVFAARAGIDREPLVRAQRELVEAEATAAELELAGRTDVDRVYGQFRRDEAQAVLGFLDSLIDESHRDSRQPAAVNGRPLQRSL